MDRGLKVRLRFWVRVMDVVKVHPKPLFRHRIPRTERGVQVVSRCRTECHTYLATYTMSHTQCHMHNVTL